MDEIRGIAERIIADFSEILSLPADRLDEVGVKVAIPTFDAQSIKALSDRAKDTFMLQETLIDVEPPVYVVGDLHGNIFDLIRILVLSGPPPANRFLFLGDYVDRGQYSVEIIALLFAFMAKYPQHMFLIRGNHEFERVNSVYGFRQEVENIYGSAAADLYTVINKCFNYMPLAALVKGDIFCVHGGISPQVSSYRQLKRVKRPITVYDNNISCDLTWSDPSLETKEFLRSTRGNGVAFGVKAVRDFQKTFKCRHILRAHQCVDLGIERFAGDAVYTVFSCSNYQDAGANRCGLIYINPEGKLQSFSLPPIDQVPRENALLTGYAVEKDESVETGAMLSSLKNDSKRGSVMCLMQSQQSLAKKRGNRSMQVFSNTPSRLPRLTPMGGTAPMMKQMPRRPGTAEPMLPMPVLPE